MVCALLFVIGCAAPPLVVTQAGPTIEPRGMLIADSTLAGERRADDVVPRHACGLQAARNRWIIVYYTHGFRGVDDERSIMYQIRRDAPDGPLLKEGFLAKTVTDWKVPAMAPPARGMVYFKQHGHAVAFGVPKGALIGGKPAPNANLFVAQWRVAARALVVKEDRLEHSKNHRDLHERTAAVEWLQFRLNDREDDIEILQPAGRMLPVDGKLPGDVAWMNQSFCPPVPANDAADTWVGCNHFDKGRLAVLKLDFNPKTSLYEWTTTGPLLSAPRPLSEASLAKSVDGWLLSARTAGAIAWFQATDPLGDWSPPVFGPEPKLSAPHTMFRCADGVLRLFAGDAAASPQKYDRDPMYMWDVTPAKTGVKLSNRQMVFDSETQKLAIRRVVRPRIDFALLFPPHNGEQLAAFSVTPRGYNFPYEGTNIPPLTAADKKASGLYFVRLRYAQDVPPAWCFAK
jgi:hypothetical protein